MESEHLIGMCNSLYGLGVRCLLVTDEAWNSFCAWAVEQAGAGLHRTPWPLTLEISGVEVRRQLEKE